MTSPDVPRASKVSSSVNVTITAPSFYNMPKKFAPVVAPKPKMNPYKSNSRPETATVLPPSSRARLGRVGEALDSGPAEDFPLPPPPPADEGLLPPPPGDIPPPPPPPPPFEDSFPPPPAEEVFPSPPGPLEEEAPAVDWPSEAQAAGSSPLDPTSSIEIEIDSLTNMLNEMQNNDPYKSRLKPSAQAVNGRTETSAKQEAAPAKPPHPSGVQELQAPSVTGPRVAGYSPVRAPKPAAVGPKLPGDQPSTPWATSAKVRPGPTTVSAQPELKSLRGPSPGPVPGLAAQASSPPAPAPEASPAQSRAAYVKPEERPGSETKPATVGQKSPWNRGVVAKEGPGVRKQPEREPGSKPPQSSGEPLPLSYKDVEDLEKLATQFMQEMDKEPKASVRPT
ncbi:uncharacterized protein LOC144678582, partial [Cetorhinus maximus]